MVWKKEIGGYIQFETYQQPMLYEDAILLNNGRSCLRYVLQAKKIDKIVLPRFCCVSVRSACIQSGVQYRYYSIREDWFPYQINLADDEWLYVVNFYGQLSNDDIKKIKDKYKRVIIDNAQSYFSEPIADVDTLYSCRKFFGVADGGVLYTSSYLKDDLAQDESFNRMHYLLGRFERSASEFYDEYLQNEKCFNDGAIKAMSKLTRNLLHGIDYEQVSLRRTENFCTLDDAFNKINVLSLRTPQGAFAYPLFVENGLEIRRKLIEQKIYIPCLWPNVLEELEKGIVEYDMAANILPLPVDQRYGAEDMEYIIGVVQENI